MEHLWSSEEISTALGNDSRHSWLAHGMSIDTRSLNPGDIFVALRGENTDGHQFVAQAFEKGAAAALVDCMPESVDDSKPLIVVTDVMQALNNLAQFARARTNARIVAVTGSVGKTSVKEALKVACEALGSTFATQGNFNNHIGLPLSMCRMPQNTEYGVFELGMNHAGELAELTQLLKPHAAIITNVEAVHLEFFDSVEAIAYAKAEILQGVQPNGFAILNADNSYFPLLLKSAEAQGVSHILAFGKNERAGFKLVSVETEGDGSRVKALIEGKEKEYLVGTPGQHQALNSLSVLAGIKALGGDIEKAMKALQAFKPGKGRTKIHHLNWQGKNITLIDDSYNASPASMRAGIDILASMAGHKLAILGDMRELGPTAPELHKELVHTLEAKSINQVFTAGNLMKHLFDALPKTMQGQRTDTALELLPIIRDVIKDKDVLFIKGSNGTHMWKLVEAILKEAA